jgi:hypothetical protein
MRAFWTLLLCVFASSARAEEPARTIAPRGTLGLDSTVTRYGTSYETVYQLSLKPRATFRFDAFELSATLPLSSSATSPTYCCRTALGNATIAAGLRGASSRLHYWTEASVSAPTSYWSDAHASSLAATAALTRDAGYYLPNTTTFRANLGGEVGVTGWLWLGATMGADLWLRHAQPARTLVLPLDIHASLPWAQGWSARVAFRTLALPFDSLGPRERFLNDLSAGVAHDGSGSHVDVSVSVPLDESLRQLEMLSLGVAYARSF